MQTTLGNLCIGKSKGPDGLGNLPLKSLAKYLAPSLTIVFNIIGKKHVYPSLWKLSILIPIFKDGDKEDISNFRLIELLACLSKILETLIFEKLYVAIGLNICKEQHGFTKCKSTMTQLILYLSEIFEHFESPTLTALYLDFEKAFDKDSHEKLIEKLQNNGITGGALELLESYLKVEKHRAKVENSICSELDVKNGVPQGSVLGPLFFIIFINDLSECILSSCFGYADDYKNIATNTITLQIDATRIWKWSSQNLMTLNIRKNKTLNVKGKGSISMNGKTLEQTQKEKDLEIIVSNDLTWTENAEKSCEKATKVFFTIKRNIANGTSWIAKKNLYRSYIVPIISYGAIL